MLDSQHPEGTHAKSLHDLNATSACFLLIRTEVRRNNEQQVRQIGCKILIPKHSRTWAGDWVNSWNGCTSEPAFGMSVAVRGWDQEGRSVLESRWDYRFGIVSWDSNPAKMPSCKRSLSQLDAIDRCLPDRGYCKSNIGCLGKVPKPMGYKCRQHASTFHKNQ